MFKIIFLALCCLCLAAGSFYLHAGVQMHRLISPESVSVIVNPDPHYTLMNSIDFHPQKNLFCVTHSQNNKIVLYKIDASGKQEMVQSLCNPSAKLSGPQHAVFSPDGKKIVVANWINQTLTIYPCEKNGLFSGAPSAVIPASTLLTQHKPHGIAFSPCGNFLAIAYGAASFYPRALALFRVSKDGNKYELLSVLEGREATFGIPKGVAFSPDGTCLLVTFSNLNSLAIFSISHKDHAIVPTPKQIIQGQETGISRPEDVKISRDGRYCAVTNSDQNTVTFYSFDKRLNQITQSTPCDVLKNPEANLSFPHSIAFSPDGAFLLLTEFGPLKTTHDEDLLWGKDTRPELAKIRTYKLL